MADFQAPQLSLSLGLRDDATFANFYPADNTHTLALIQGLLTGQSEHFIYLHGRTDSGKSHLLQALCHRADDLSLRSVYLPLTELALMSPDVLENLESLDLVCIDDLNLVSGRPGWEVALFHCFNRLRDAGKRLIISADTPPAQLGVRLPDLASRLAWGLTLSLHKLNDDQKATAFRLRARERGLDLNDDVLRYLMHRSPRSLKELFNLLEILDHASLMAQRKITIPFVRETLDW